MMFVINTTIWVVFEPYTTENCGIWVKHNDFSKHHSFWVEFGLISEI